LAEKHHDVALVDDDGQLVARRRITETVEGFAELTTMLAEAGDNAEDPIPVAIETPRGLLVHGVTRHRPADLLDKPDGGGPLPISYVESAQPLIMVSAEDCVTGGDRVGRGVGG
jgi:hypothetical protein